MDFERITNKAFAQILILTNRISIIQKICFFDPFQELVMFKRVIELKIEVAEIE